MTSWPFLFPHEAGRWVRYLLPVRLQISGLIEVEAGYEKIGFNDPAIEDEKNSDVDLATVELDVDARIIDHVDGHVLFKVDDLQEADTLTVQMAVTF